MVSYVPRPTYKRNTKYTAAKKKVTTKPRKTIVKKTTRYPLYKSVQQNASMIRMLRKSQIGLYQRRMEKFDFSGHIEEFNRDKPFAFCVNQFVDRETVTPFNPILAPLYGCEHTPTGLETYVLSDRFSHYQYPLVDEKHDPHWKTNNEHVSGEYYQPLGTKLQFAIEYTGMAKDSDPQVIRIDIVTPNKRVPQSNNHSLNMPAGLPQFQRLAHNTMLDRNQISKTYWKVLQTKYIICDNKSGVAKNIRKQCTVNLRLGPKILKPDITSGEKFIENIDPKDLIWCIISTNKDDADPSTYHPDVFTMRRDIAWRDPTGTSL